METANEIYLGPWYVYHWDGRGSGLPSDLVKLHSEAYLKRIHSSSRFKPIAYTLHWVGHDETPCAVGNTAPLCLQEGETQRLEGGARIDRAALTSIEVSKVTVELPEPRSLVVSLYARGIEGKGGGEDPGVFMASANPPVLAEGDAMG